MSYQNKFTISLLGGGAVGKTAITLRFINGQFSEEYIPSIKEEYSKTVVSNGVSYELSIIDTAGQEEFNQMRFRYLQSADGFIFVYSVEDQTSLYEVMDIWKDACQAKDTDKVLCIFAGNKVDLPEKQKKVSLSQAKNFLAQTKGEVIETSAKTSQNIDQLFEKMVDLFSLSQKNKGKQSHGKKTKTKAKKKKKNEKKNSHCLLL